MVVVTLSMAPKLQSAGFVFTAVNVTGLEGAEGWGERGEQRLYRHHRNFGGTVYLNWLAPSLPKQHWHDLKLLTKGYHPSAQISVVVCFPFTHTQMGT